MEAEHLAAGRGAILLGQLEMFFECLGLGQEGDCLGDLGVPLGADLEAFELSELGGEEVALDALLDPVAYAGDVAVGVVDAVGLEEGLELLHDGVVDHEVLGDGVGGEVVFAEVEEGVVLQERVLKTVGLEVYRSFRRG
jgi:hypothetical protein